MFTVLFDQVSGKTCAFGCNAHGQLDLPSDDFLQAAAGKHHGAFLRADGAAVLSGNPVARLSSDADGQLPAAAQDDWHVVRPREGERYIRAAVGDLHTLLLTDSGRIDSFGSNWRWQCQVPQLSGGARYVEVAAAKDFSVALCSDQTAVTWGGIDYMNGA